MYNTKIICATPVSLQLLFKRLRKYNLFNGKVHLEILLAFIKRHKRKKKITMNYPPVEQFLNKY